MTTVLGIETSCDETAVAVVDDGVTVRSNVVASQIELHRKYGGVVPEIASRAHIENLDTIVQDALDQAECAPSDVDVIAVTNRPGLVPALLIGVTAAKTLSWAWQKPLVGVDHIHAHAYSPAIGLAQPPWPAVALIVSGGHTSLFRVNGPADVQLLGATLDDAAGEAFDKVATILGLPYPGGPEIEKAAKHGDAKTVDFPRTMLKRGSLDFSFSGIKTAVRYHIHGHGKISGGLEKRSPADIANVAASFQQAVVDVLVKKAMLAVAQTGLSNVILGGGVAANGALRSAMEEVCRTRDINFVAAPWAYCTDNAAMIAALGFHMWQRGDIAGLDLDALANSSTRVA